MRKKISVILLALLCLLLSGCSVVAFSVSSSSQRKNTSTTQQSTTAKYTEGATEAQTLPTESTTSGSSSAGYQYYGIVVTDRMYLRESLEMRDKYPTMYYHEGDMVYIDSLIDGYALITYQNSTYYVMINSMDIYVRYANGTTTLVWDSTYTDMEATYERLAKQVVDMCIEPSMTKWQQVDAINDYLCNIITYDLDYYTAYDAIVNGVARCQGYANAFKVIMDELGITCDIIYGDADNGDGNRVSHAWNRVIIDNYYYLVDVTWNDNGLESSDKYLGMSEEEFSKTHFMRYLQDYLAE